MDTLQAATDIAVKDARVPREKAIFKAEVASGVKDCVKSTYKFFPEYDWAKLGPEAVAALEEVKADEVAPKDSSNPVVHSKRPLEEELGGETEEKGPMETKEALPEDPPVVSAVDAMIETPVADLVTPDSKKASSPLAT